MKPNIAIITSNKNGSPKVLAETLSALLNEMGVPCKVFYKIKSLRRLLNYKQTKQNIFIWNMYKFFFFISDYVFFRRLNYFDAIVLCNTTPSVFKKETYDIPRFRNMIPSIPLLYYAVQYLYNSPTQVEKLQEGGHHTGELFDWHLSVSSITELRSKPQAPWSQIGMYFKATGLEPKPKKEFYAIVDFPREGFESYREIQIKALQELDIPYIEFEGEYELDEIRKYYQEAAILFIQFPEAFGVPIAECFACGTMIGTPDSSWAMSWRLDEEVEIHGPGKLPNCFMLYDGVEDLKKQLAHYRDNFHFEDSPKKVFDSFVKHYPSFYYGNKEALEDVLTKIENKTLKL